MAMSLALRRHFYNNSMHPIATLYSYIYAIFHDFNQTPLFTTKSAAGQKACAA